MQHFRQCGYCVSGIRDWFENNDLNFREFVQHGIDVKLLDVRNDALVNKAIEIAQGELDGKE